VGGGGGGVGGGGGGGVGVGGWVGGGVCGGCGGGGFSPPLRSLRITLNSEGRTERGGDLPGGYGLDAWLFCSPGQTKAVKTRPELLPK